MKILAVGTSRSLVSVLMTQAGGLKKVKNSYISETFDVSVTFVRPSNIVKEMVDDYDVVCIEGVRNETSVGTLKMEAIRQDKLSTGSVYYEVRKAIYGEKTVWVLNRRGVDSYIHSETHVNAPDRLVYFDEYPTYALAKKALNEYLVDLLNEYETKAEQIRKKLKE